MSDLIERLRSPFPCCEYHKAVIDTQRLKREAADALERLTERAELAEAERDALEFQRDGANETAERWRLQFVATVAERDALRADAERYRWLRSAKTGKPISVATTHSSWNTWINTTELDAAIDAAMKESSDD